MKAELYEPVSVLFVARGFSRRELPYKFTPYRFERQNGESFKIEKVSMYHNDFRGGAQQFHYTVHTEDDFYCRLLFDGETLSWRLVEVKKEGIDLLKQFPDAARIKSADLPVRALY
jgi:hypothetical protein